VTSAFSAIALVLATAALLGQTRAEQEKQREQWQKVPEIFAAMGVRSGATVADVGAGDGFFTSRLARAVGPNGRVYAVDVSDAALDRLRKRLAEDGIQDVVIVKSAPDDPRLPENTIDAALIINAYHEMDQHQSMLSALRRALKADGRLVVVEPVSPSRRGRPRAEQTKSHEIDPEYLLQDARASGFRVIGLQDPFTRRQGDIEWMMTLQPGDLPAVAAAPQQPEPPVSVAWKDPAIRVSFDEFTALAAGRAVTIIDGRDPESFASGHIPGALSVPLETVENAAERLRKLGKPIVSYCS
jgi:predicted methyltransferase